jgi:alkanesulfonate monooxygenase SsuD/methylene tetrahydromethanopterin reductase-like flavin-dependent oxidoreductase (luciferase family)
MALSNDPSVSRKRPMVHPMFGPNRFKLGIFSANADGGLTLTRVPERWPATWEQVVEVARMADRAGIEFFLPIARWKGFGGEFNHREWSFETLTYAAALAGATRRIGLFSTVHVPMVHPVFAAKALATVDHASGGRAGLNIVCGWSPQEFDLFGLRLIDDRYAQGHEWAEIAARIFAGEPPFDYRGRFYQLKKVSGLPLPVQRPRPVMISVAFSDVGREFAVRASDFLFTTFVDITGAPSLVADIAARANAAGRSVGVYATSHVVCRPTQAEAEDYYEHYAVQMEDTASVDDYMRAKENFSGSHEPEAYRRHRKRFVGGAGTYPLVGTPRHIADEMVRMSEAGFAGTTVSFVNFRDELPYFIDTVLPLLRESGLRDS